MGFGMNVWDLLRQGQQVDPEEEARKRREEAMYQPVEDVQPQTPLHDEEVNPPEIIQAPKILGSDAHETTDILGKYKDWLSRRPTDEQNKPSTGRKILGTLAGFLAGVGGGPQAAASVTHSIVHGRQDEAMHDWEEEGKAIGDVGKFAENVAENRRQREGAILQYGTAQDKVEAERSSIEQRKEAENLRHQDRMSSLTSDNARRQELARHNQALEGIAIEANKVKAVEARAATAQAAAATTNAATRAGELKLKQAQPPRPKPAHYRAAVQDAIREMLPLYPDMQDMFEQDKNGNWIPTSDTLSPEKVRQFQGFLADARKRADRNLGLDKGVGEEAGEGRQPASEEVDEYTPIRENY